MQANDVRTVYASGTAYSLTDTSAALDFGTTDPSFTLTQPGSYLLISRATLKYTGATFAAVQTATLKLRRTNNTPGDVVGATTTRSLDIVTTASGGLGSVQLPSVIYQTNNNNDILTIYGVLSAATGAGTVDVSEAEIIAIRLF